MFHMRTVGAVLSIGLALAISGCGSTDEPQPSTGGIEISGAWVRATTTAQDSTMTGAFLEVSNSTETPARLVGARSPVAKMVQIHTMVMRDGKMVMQELAGGLEIKAGSHAHLRPSGDHVMLMGLTAPLAPGDEIPLTLMFDNGTEQTLSVPVKEFTEEENHYDPSMTPQPSMTPAS